LLERSSEHHPRDAVTVGVWTQFAVTWDYSGTTSTSRYIRMVALELKSVTVPKYTLQDGNASRIHWHGIDVAAAAAVDADFFEGLFIKLEWLILHWIRAADLPSRCALRIANRLPSAKVCTSVTLATSSSNKAQRASLRLCLRRMLRLRKLPCSTSRSKAS
jgi:hypothetical protein